MLYALPNKLLPPGCCNDIFYKALLPVRPDDSANDPFPRSLFALLTPLVSPHSIKEKELRLIFPSLILNLPLPHSAINENNLGTEPFISSSLVYLVGVDNDSRH